MRSVLRWAASAALILVLTLVFAEGSLQLLSLAVRGRASLPHAGAATRVLCVGDSHTYGAGVPEPESYPAQLQGFLDQRVPGGFAVVNAGVPGMNSAQARRRLPGLLTRHRPQYLLIWVGENNGWNSADLHSFDTDGTPSFLEWLMTYSRLSRLLVTWYNDRQIDKVAAGMLRGRINAEVTKPLADGETWKITDGNAEEQFVHRHAVIPDEEAKRTVERDVDEMVRYARARGVRVILITYPLERVGFFGPADQALKTVAASLSVPLVDSAQSLRRVPQPEQRWIWALHPTGPIYREIARDTAALVAP